MPGDPHRQMADTAARRVYQHPLTGADARRVHQRLSGGEHREGRAAASAWPIEAAPARTGGTAPSPIRRAHNAPDLTAVSG
ncbi:hypothetical protein SHKM778_50530 [Streptomyces sp. KM77-8]|uniref:Uncharacterized protein n=1 Tax=Streptomyces haneummycinicus TaxID=3074435 RepID=A0AAT9HMT3_9ACTN